MKILAIDTSAAACSVALLINNDIHSIHQIMPTQQAQTILPFIQEILKNQNIDLKQLDALAFGCGPGSFTGVRIAASVIQGLGFGLNIPVIPISSLAALAQAAYHDLNWKKMLVATDARIQEVYYGAYEINQDGRVSLVGNEAVSKPADIIFPNDSGWYGVGNGWEVYQNQILYSPLAIDPTRLPTASAVALLAKHNYIHKEWLSAEQALPVYLRNEVAKKQF